MKIAVLGTGCAKCTKLYENVQIALQNTGVNAEVIKVTDLEDIMKYSIMFTPALAINDKKKCESKVASVEEIEKWIKEEKENV